VLDVVRNPNKVDRAGVHVWGVWFAGIAVVARPLLLLANLLFFASLLLVMSLLLKAPRLLLAFLL
jgi:hypothetical protein